MSDLRIFEATLQACVARHQRAYLVVDTTVGVVALFASLCAARAAFCVGAAVAAAAVPAADADDDAGCMVSSVVWLAVWCVLLLALHGVRSAAAIVPPAEYASGMNAVLRRTFGWRYDVFSEKLVVAPRTTPAAR